MSSRGKGALSGILVASAILLIALIIVTPDGMTFSRGIAIGIAVGVTIWYQTAAAELPA